jgi:hypothetical protein
MTRKTKSARPTGPVNRPIDRLSFAADRDGNALPKPKGRQSPRCFWHVKPTGDLWADEVTGESLALEYLTYEETKGPDSPSILPWIVKDMPRDLTSIEISFLTIVGFAAAEGPQRAREICAYWERCRKEMAQKKNVFRRVKARQPEAVQ